MMTTRHRPAAVPVPAGLDMYEYLHQGDFWLTPDGLIPVASMAPDHRGQSARWLLDNATGLILLCEGKINEDIVSGETSKTLHDVFTMMNTRPKDWVLRLPLYRALIDTPLHG